MSKSVVARPSQGADPDMISRTLFATRLKALMEKRGLTVAAVAERMRVHLPAGEGFATSNLSHYRQGRSVPREHHLQALAAALSVDPHALLGAEASPRAPEPRDQGLGSDDDEVGVVPEATPAAPVDDDDTTSLLVVEDFGSEVRLIINQRVPWEVGLKMLQILKGHTDD